MRLCGSEGPLRFERISDRVVDCVPIYISAYSLFLSIWNSVLRVAAAYRAAKESLPDFPRGWLLHWHCNWIMDAMIIDYFVKFAPMTAACEGKKDKVILSVTKVYWLLKLYSRTKRKQKFVQEPMIMTSLKSTPYPIVRERLTGQIFRTCEEPQALPLPELATKSAYSQRRCKRPKHHAVSSRHRGCLLQ